MSLGSHQLDHPAQMLFNGFMCVVDVEKGQQSVSRDGLEQITTSAKICQDLLKSTLFLELLHDMGK